MLRPKSGLSSFQIIGLTYVVLDSLLVSIHNCGLLFEEPTSYENVSIFQVFHSQYLAGKKCFSFISKIYIECIFPYALKKRRLVNVGYLLGIR